MADDEEQETSEDTRMQLVQQYCLKTIKQVLMANLFSSSSMLGRLLVTCGMVYLPYKINISLVCNLEK